VIAREEIERERLVRAAGFTTEDVL